MTIEDTSPKTTLFACNGVTTEFPFVFTVVVAADIEVILLTTALNIETVLTQDTEYEVTISEDGTGSITTISFVTDAYVATAYSDDYQLLIRRATEKTQDLSLPEHPTRMAVFDKLTRITQELEEQISRALLLTKTTTLSGLELPNPVANNPIGWNSLATGLKNFSSTTVTVPQIDYIGNYADLATAVSTIGSTPTTLMINSATIIASGVTVTIPNTLLLWPILGGSIDGVSGGGVETLAFSGLDPKAGLYQIFGSNITVTGLKEVYPEWWGAAGDGVTDDTTAMQSSFSGETILLSRKTYLTTSVLTIPSGVSIIGKGRESVIKTATATTDLLNIFGTKSAVVTSDLSDNAALHQTTVSVADGSIFTAGDYIFIESTGTVTTDAYEINQIESISTNDLTVETPLYDTYLTADGAKVSLLIPKQNVHLENFKLFNVSGGTGLGFYFKYVINCSAKNITTEYCYKNNIYYSNNVDVIGLNTSNANIGVDVRYSKFCIVDSGYFKDSTVGIGTQYYSDACQIINNRIVNTSLYGIFYEHHNDDGLIYGNVIHYSEEYGIVIDYGIKKTGIIGNNIKYTDGVGIANVASNHAVIVDNIISYSNYGINIEGSSSCTVNGNILTNIGSNSGQHGINFQSTAQGDVSYNTANGNIIDTCTGESIRMNNSVGTVTHNSISNNIVLNCANIGFRILAGVANTKLKNNTITGTFDKANGIVNVGSNVIGDHITETVSIDLSGAAITIPIFHTEVDVMILEVTYLYTEASSADAGIAMELGHETDRNAYQEYTSEASQDKWFSHTFIRTDFLYIPGKNGYVAAGNTVTIYSAGSKSGTGEVKVIVSYCTL